MRTRLRTLRDDVGRHNCFSLAFVFLMDLSFALSLSLSLSLYTLIVVDGKAD